MDASDIVHVVPHTYPQGGVSHWLYLRDGTIVCINPQTGRVEHAAALPSREAVQKFLETPTLPTSPSVDPSW